MGNIRTSFVKRIAKELIETYNSKLPMISRKTKTG